MTVGAKDHISSCLLCNHFSKDYESTNICRKCTNNPNIAFTCLPSQLNARFTNTLLHHQVRALALTPEGCRLQRADDITLRDAGHLAVDGHTDTDTDRQTDRHQRSASSLKINHLETM